MKEYKLGEICTFIGGGTPSKSIDYYWNGDIPWASVKDLKEKYISETELSISFDGVKNSSTNIANKDDLILCTRISPGKCAITLKETAINQDLKIVRPIIQNLYINEYLYYQFILLENEIISLSSGSTVKGITLEKIKELQVKLPTIDEQKRIVNILDIAQALIDKRKQAIAKLDELVQAVFLDMFGQFSDTNCKIKDVIISLQAGLSTGGETRQKQGSELGVLTTSAVTSGEFIDTAYKVPSEKDIKLNKLVFPTKNSILVSRMNTRELVGASAIIEKDYNDLFIPDRLWKLTLDQRIVNPYYFLFVIQAKKIRDEVSRLSSGTSGSMLNISQEKYLGIDFYLPAKQLQDQFASMIIQIRNTKNKMKLQLQQLESNFQALLQKAFKGELTVKDGVAV
ncbi:restriction endonuclease subunit S [Brevibacillus agri]|uniref:restriction endonuclease subunit S n=1 Tax=Brevibacillus agri TaxID=51101 RepID=UPI001EE53236|nr:restriction endonuclease subunit S [Brevibacillus agri]